MAPLLSFHPHQTLIPTSSLLSTRPIQIQSRLHFLARPVLLSRATLSTRLCSTHFHHQLEDLLGRADGFLYSIADAAVAAQDPKPNADWFSGIASYMELILKILKDGLSTLHVPYAYGFAIILLTVLVKAATFPLTKKQVESALAVRTLQPQVKAIQQQYAGDQERIQLETARLYKLAGINPLAGCFPTLLTVPIWIGLYRALSNVANEGLLSEGFFWIPSLAGPTTIAARQSGTGISWLFPFKDGEPPLGWSDTLAYLVLPVLLVITQYISTQILQGSQSQSNDPSQQSAQTITKFLPLLLGYFALSVPSGLSLYWLTNNILSTAQQIWLQKHGGAKNPVKEYIEKVSRDEQMPTIDILKPQIEELDSSQDGVGRGERFKQIKGEEERRKKPKMEPDMRGQRFKQIKEEEERRRKAREEERERQKEIEKESVTIVEEKSNHEELIEDERDDMPFSLNGGLNRSSDESVTDDTNENGGSS
ncbi:Membrane protein insertase YidC [Rhynchospora pubera]|uniref:Membrane protein insertase YidC n=1 Tax=Rhynchospora pubera TaxID=906938 RepID=A0AAV8G1S8_9POAL|nr:Membrane protein insertase YidC [Rhynchospora pubera]